jgi:putative membrane protein
VISKYQPKANKSQNTMKLPMMRIFVTLYAISISCNTSVSALTALRQHRRRSVRANPLVIRASLEDDYDFNRQLLMKTKKDQRMQTYAELARERRRTVFTHDDWLEHRATDRFRRNLWNIFGSSIVQNLVGDIASIVGICIFVIGWNELLFDGYVDFAALYHAPPFAALGDSMPEIWLPGVPFTSSSTALGLLLVFRTNTCYSRWLEGRSQWGQIVTQCRCIILMGATWTEPENEKMTSEQQRVSREKALHRLGVSTWAFPRVLRKHLQQDFDPDDQFIDDIRKGLKDYPEQAEKLLDARHRPFRALYDLHQAVNALPNLAIWQKIQIADSITAIGDACGACERLYTAPVPLVYTRHTERCIALWIFLLPAALYEPFGGEHSFNHIAMIPAAAILAFLFLGIEEIAVSLEEPFSILPLDRLSDDSRLASDDVMEWMFGGESILPVNGDLTGTNGDLIESDNSKSTLVEL